MNDKRLHLITGTDELVIQAKAKELFLQLAGPDPDPFSMDVFPEPEEGPSPAPIIEATRSLQSPSLLGGNKIVWLKHCSCLDQEGSDKGNGIGKALKELGQILKAGIPEGIVFLLDGTDIDKRKTIYKICSTQGTVQFWEKPNMANRDWEQSVRNFIAAGLQEKRLRLSPSATDYLVEVLGTDTARLSQELEKIICYRGTTEGEVSEEELRQICVGKGEEMSWALGEKLGKRDLSETLRIIDVLIAQNGMDEGYSRAMFLAASGFFRTCIRLRIFMAQKKLRAPSAMKSTLMALTEEEKEACREKGMDFVDFHPYRAQIMAEQSSRYTPEELIRAIVILQESLKQTTTSGLSPRLALENALVTILSQNR